MIKATSKFYVPALLALSAASQAALMSTSAIVSASTAEQIKVTKSVSHSNDANQDAVLFSNGLDKGAITFIEANGHTVFSEAQQAEAKQRIDLMVRISPSLSVLPNGEMQLTLTKAELQSKYGLTTTQLALVNSIMTNYNIGVFGGTSDVTKSYFKGGNLYLSYGEVVGILSAVNDIGPMALVAAISAASSVVPGIGTFIGAAVGLLGAGTIILAMADAVANRKGIRIGLGGIAAVKY
ncbi:MAG: hypothetical protein LKJ48_12645 [Lactobacillus sp.]|jgi:hypothetical protein|nr:hypothetical protein [Lactobacillus sp.]